MRRIAIGIALTCVATQVVAQHEPYFEEWPEGSALHLIGDGIVDAGCTVTADELADIIRVALASTGETVGMTNLEYVDIMVGNLLVRQQAEIDEAAGTITLKSHECCA